MDALSKEQRVFIAKAIRDLLDDYDNLLQTSPYWDTESSDEVKTARKALEMLQ